MLLFVNVLHISVCVFLIIVVLLQQGKGADAGATFGGGGGTMFGASGADTLLTKITTGAALVFMATSIFLAKSSHDIFVSTEGDLFKDAPEASAQSDIVNINTGDTLVDAPAASVPAEPSTTQPGE